MDELAHGNAPGGRHGTRWQDVEELLEAGIEVISTVDIGLLNSLAEVVEKITGVLQRECVPDPVVRVAAEVQIVDITPEALRDRMARGNIYPAQRAEAALAGWFQTGNLAALRELALFWLAAKLAEDPQRYRSVGHSPSGQAPERVVVALSGSREGEMLIRRAARVAARSGGELLAVCAAQSGHRTAASRAVLAAQRRLTELVGGTYHQLADAGIPAGLLAFAHAQGATQLVLGASRPTWPALLLPAATIGSVIRRGGGIDVHLVTCTPTANGRQPAGV